MKINHLLCARLATNLTLLVFTLFILGIALWLTDSILGWDILPHGIEQYAQLFILMFGVFACLLVVSSLLCSFTVLAEFAAQQVGIQAKAYPLFTRKKLAILAIVIAGVLVTFFIFHKIDEYREESRLAKNRVEFREKLVQQSKQLDKSLSHIVTLFPNTILQSFDNQTIQEKPATQELVKLLGAISLSIPDEPQVALLIPTKPPYKYQKIWISSKHRVVGSYKGFDESEKILSSHKAHQQFFTQFSNPIENDIVAALFLGKIKPLKASLEGHFLDNSEPSTWGILKYNNKMVALIYIEGTIEGYGRVRSEIFHSGPDNIISN